MAALKSWVWSGHEYVFWTVTGEVLGSSKHSETHVSSSGGGGYLHRGSGRVEAAQISSVVQTHHEIWLRQNDGKETAIQLVNSDLPLRTGQRVSFLMGSPKGHKSGWYLRLANHSAARWWEVQSVKRAMAEWPPFKHWGRRILMPLTGGLAVYWVLRHVSPAAAGPAGWGVGLLLCVGLSVKLWLSALVARRSLKKHLDVVIQDVFRQGG